VAVGTGGGATCHQYLWQLDDLEPSKFSDSILRCQRHDCLQLLGHRSSTHDRQRRPTPKSNVYTLLASPPLSASVPHTNLHTDDFILCSEHHSRSSAIGFT
jgi:hypothetical protein